ncbi:MAG: hydroxymethylbilane synthase [Chlamydiota bacterium]|nr:hydroxymethylbilane synthase [Chlamydiota bacterium]
MLKKQLELLSESFEITVGARSSALSKVQVEEVLSELNFTYPNITFKKCFTDTVGDRDQKTSLRNLGKTDFFTYDVDKMLLDGQIRVGIHSAKDLPDPLPKGIVVVALTRGVDSTDSLVLQPGVTLESLPKNAKIATSSLRREEAVKELRKDLCFVDIRGCIETRLSYLKDRKVDGVVIAEAALIRLDRTDLNRITLPGSTVEGQGQLAITALDRDQEMQELFSSIDSRLLAALP